MSTKRESAQPSQDGREALELAAVLSQRARAEAETARLLTEHIAAMGAPAQPSAARPPSAAPASPASQVMQVGCRSCEVEQTVSLDDPETGAAQARQFFARHCDCLTFVELDPIRRAI